MFFIKAATFAMTVVFLLNTYALVQTTSNISSNKPTVETTQTVVTEEQNTISKQNSIEDIKSPYQAKPRRKKIEFPDDCHYFPNSSDKNWRLQLTCASALDTIQSELPQDHNCDYDSYRNNLYYDEVHAYQVYDYTVKEVDIGVVEALAERLGTTKENIAKNSNLKNPDNLEVGQQLKYEKVYRRKYPTSWLERYTSEYPPVFHPLSPNKYLAELRCVTGAYNVQNIYLLYDESAIPAKAEVLEFPSFDFSVVEDSDEPTSIKKIMIKTVGGRWFNPKTKELVVFVKAHGIGDAGRYARYSFPKGKPKLEEYRARFKWSGPEYTPDEIIRHPPKTWKRYYP